MVSLDEVEQLEKLGLSKNETLVYLGLLEDGPSTATQIAKSTRLHRPNVYDALKRLSQKGLISQSKREDKTFYIASEPAQLLDLLRDKERMLQELIPKLEVRQLGASKHPANIEVFEGIAGVRKAMSDILKQTKEFFVLGTPKDAAIIVGEGWIKSWHQERTRRKIWFHHIVNEDYYPHRIKLLRSLPCTTIKFLPREYNMPISAFIYDRGIVMTLLHSSPPLAIRITDEETASAFKKYFQLVWKLATNTAPQEKSKK